MTRMTGANMHLVTVNVKLGENDPEPEQKLDPVRRAFVSVFPEFLCVNREKTSLI